MISKIPKTRSMISKNSIDTFLPANPFLSQHQNNIFYPVSIAKATASNTFDRQATNFNCITTTLITAFLMKISNFVFNEGYIVTNNFCFLLIGLILFGWNVIPAGV